MNRLFLLADLLIKKGVKFRTVLEIGSLSLPFVFAYIAPLAMMVAGVMTFGKLSQDNELTALKVCGVNPLKLILPTLLVTILFSCLMVSFNGFLLPESEHKLRNLLLDLARKKPAVKIREGVFMDEFGEWTIYIGSLQEKGGKISDIFLFRKGGESPLFITAKKGLLKTAPNEEYLSLHLFAGEVHELVERDKYRKLKFAEHIVNLPIENELMRREREYRSLSEMNFLHLLATCQRLSEEKSAILAQIRELEKERGLDPIKIRIEEEKNRLRYKMREIERYQGELHKRLSLAFSCIFFFLFGSFLGIVLKRGSLGFAFLATLIYFAIYYILLIVGEKAVAEGNLPSYLALHFPNLILIPVILEFAHRVLFDRSLFLNLWPKKRDADKGL